ncbi:MAG TPA: hypothetical protein VK914_09590 [bacterium]|nr:hypothetical protein [bacterium]
MTTDLNWYAGLFARDHIPTVLEYNEANGEGDEAEVEFQLALCKERGWGDPAKQSDCQCIKFIRQVADNPGTTPSLYLVWLKNNFPPFFKVVVIKHRVVREKRDGSSIAPYELIDAFFGNVHVELSRNIEGDLRIPLGRIRIIKINKISIGQIADKYLKRHEGEIADGLVGGARK